MEYIPRKLLFKAWNKETKLLMRLSNIECIKGELFKTDHILLQFTGLYDKQQDEIYDMDVIMIGADKFIVMWHSGTNGWGLAPLEDEKRVKPFNSGESKAAIRLWNYFESAAR
jgi:hypothetical protein